jgi:hypothetical protein
MNVTTRSAKGTKFQNRTYEWVEYVQRNNIYPTCRADILHTMNCSDFTVEPKTDDSTPPPTKRQRTADGKKKKKHRSHLKRKSGCGRKKTARVAKPKRISRR